MNYLAVAEWWNNLNNIIDSSIVSIVLRILGAGLVLLIGFKIARVIANLYDKSKSAAKLNKTVRNFLKNIKYI